jgi:hypothetical protein
MTTSPLEDRIRAALRHQADSMRVPEASPDDRLLRVAHPPQRPQWGRVVLAAAAIVAVGGGALVVQGRDDSSGTRVVPGAPVRVHHFETPTVVMDAASVEVIAGGRSWVPPADVTVAGDPGLPNEKSTLELTWHDGEMEQRIFIYFKSDGIDWWADQIRTYNGEHHGDWLEPAASGEFFRSPLGTAFSGDLELPNLRIESMVLQAFVPPDVCGTTSASSVLVADYPVADMAADSGFGASFQVVDTASCEPLPVAEFTFEFAAADPSIVTINTKQIDGYPPAKFRIGLRPLAEGTTTITATARTHAGDIAGTAQMTVNVQPPVGTSDTAPIPITLPPITAEATPVDVSDARFGGLTSEMLQAAEMGDYTPWLDYVEISDTAPSGEPLYVSALGMAQQSEPRDVTLPAINRDGTVIGYLVPGQALLIDGQPVREISPPTTS